MQKALEVAELEKEAGGISSARGEESKKKIWGRSPT